MVRKINPAWEAYQDAVRSGYTEEELKKLLKDLELDEKDIPETIELREVEGTKPVTTLKTIEDEEMSIEAPGGPIATQRQREAAAKMAEQIRERGDKPPVA